MHNCQMSTPMRIVSVDNEEHSSVLTVDNSVHCPEFEQTFNQPGNLNRLKYLCSIIYKPGAV